MIYLYVILYIILWLVFFLTILTGMGMVGYVLFTTSFFNVNNKNHFRRAKQLTIGWLLVFISTVIMWANINYIYTLILSAR